MITVHRTRKIANLHRMLALSTTLFPLSLLAPDVRFQIRGSSYEITPYFITTAILSFPPSNHAARIRAQFPPPSINLLEFRYIVTRRNRGGNLFFLADRSSFSISHPRPSDFFRFFFPLFSSPLFFSSLLLEIRRGGFAFTTVDRVGSRSPEYAMRFIRNVAYKTQRTVYDW